jgi:hypothetical protein
MSVSAPAVILRSVYVSVFPAVTFELTMIDISVYVPEVGIGHCAVAAVD